ncbi:unnamed protein product [Vitrella brassicaformis CCMP3155]|uniref:FAST kinase leucine-rich domain-containing protein n=1 Tax=Vitrella brassicaformis (strain CCMP3155) TaxID=1169540 RepID=A0A0G4GDR4_VITBC|nr:unnamed protein product [Vitrella brassicaformis CCMP3155]|eukprot:CEM27532.1 unnamed protein product [Vitrella brassicaformis CCMP3155]
MRTDVQPDTHRDHLPNPDPPSAVQKKKLNRRINSQIMDEATTPAVLQWLLETKLPQMDVRNAVAVVYRLAKDGTLHTPATPLMLASLFQHIHLPAADPQAVANLLWALAALKNRGLLRNERCREAISDLRRGLLDMLLARSSWERMRLQEVSMSVWGLARLNWAVDAAAISHAIRRVLGDFRSLKPKEMSTLAWALTTWRHQQHQRHDRRTAGMIVAFFRHVEHRILADGRRGILASYSHQAVANLLWSYCVHRGESQQLSAARSEAVLTALTKEVEQRGPHFSAADLPSVAWATLRETKRGEAVSSPSVERLQAALTRMLVGHHTHSLAFVAYVFAAEGEQSGPFFSEVSRWLISDYGGRLASVGDAAHIDVRDLQLGTFVEGFGRGAPVQELHHLWPAIGCYLLAMTCTHAPAADTQPPPDIPYAPSAAQMTALRMILTRLPMKDLSHIITGLAAASSRMDEHRQETEEVREFITQLAEDIKRVLMDRGNVLERGGGVVSGGAWGEHGEGQTDRSEAGGIQSAYWTVARVFGGLSALGQLDRKLFDHLAGLLMKII